MCVHCTPVTLHHGAWAKTRSRTFFPPAATGLSFPNSSPDVYFAGWNWSATSNHTQTGRRAWVKAQLALLHVSVALEDSPEFNIYPERSSRLWKEYFSPVSGHIRSCFQLNVRLQVHVCWDSRWIVGVQQWQFKTGGGLVDCNMAVLAGNVVQSATRQCLLENKGQGRTFNQIQHVAKLVSSMIGITYTKDIYKSQSSSSCEVCTEGLIRTWEEE